MKFFPAETAGGRTAALRAFATVFPEIAFCPTGGIAAANLGAYLALPNVLCGGGSWLANRAAVAAADWPQIQRVAASANALAAGFPQASE